MVATQDLSVRLGAHWKLSVPFSSGQWLLLNDQPFVKVIALHLSVPFSSGQWLLQTDERCATRWLFTFSPLFIGAMVATWMCVPSNVIPLGLSVPFSSGQWLLHENV